MSRIRVGISEYAVSSAPDEIVTIGLGSCVGIAIYDPISGHGGLSHILLPDSTSFEDKSKPEKFADLAIPAMISELKSKTRLNPLFAKIAGGSSMFSHTVVGGIGEKNIAAVIEALKKNNIPIMGSHTGGSISRTMLLDLSSFNVTISTGNKEIIIL